MKKTEFYLRPSYLKHVWLSPCDMRNDILHNRQLTAIQ